MPTGFIGVPGVNMGGDLTGVVSNAQIATGTVGIAELAASALKPAVALYENLNRMRTGLDNLALLVSQRLHLVAIDLPAGVLVTSIAVCSGTTAMVTPANQWFGLFDSARVALRLTTDDTTVAWAANTVKVLNLTATFTTTYSGLHYIGILVNAATVPSFVGVVDTNSVISGLVPILSGSSNTPLTTPPGLPFTAIAITPTVNKPYCQVR